MLFVCELFYIEESQLLIKFFYLVCMLFVIIIVLVIYIDQLECFLVDSVCIFLDECFVYNLILEDGKMLVVFFKIIFSI